MTDIETPPGSHGDLPRPRPRPALGDCTDSELLAAAAHQDGEAFGEFYLRYGSRILGYFRPRCATTQDAYDLMAETFAEAFSSIGSFDGARGVPIAWLYGIARNVYRHYARQGAVETRARERLHLVAASLGQDELDQLETSLDMEAIRRQVGAAIDTLPKAEREAVRLRCAGLDYPQIADRLGLRPEAVRQRVSRGFIKLGKRLGDSPFTAND